MISDSRNVGRTNYGCALETMVEVQRKVAVIKLVRVPSCLIGDLNLLVAT